ncbi:MAG: YqaJ viral recombinase family protein [Duodenibacillus sp.]|nr:YqaJ viral recombinase family protein [Duodenibacillus sp.]
MTVTYEQAAANIPADLPSNVKAQIAAQATPPATDKDKAAAAKRAAWLETRRSGIGGSDVAAVLGLSKWRTAVDVYMDKLSEGHEQEQSDPMYWGTMLEQLVAKEFERRTGMKVQRVNTTLRKGEDGWMIANIDRAIVNPEISGNVRVIPEEKRTSDRMLTTDVILECKTANAYSASEWGDTQEHEIRTGELVTEHKIPVFYETQVQWYMGITGAKTCYVAVLIGGSDFRIYKVDRDEDVIKALVEHCGKFWRENVLAHKAPDPVCVADVQKLFPHSTDEMDEATNEEAADIGELRTLSERIDELKRQQEVVKTRLTASIGDRLGLLIAGEKACTFKSQSATRLDSTKLKKTHPALFQQFAKTSETRTFRLA